MLGFFLNFCVQQKWAVGQFEVFFSRELPYYTEVDFVLLLSLDNFIVFLILQ
jgi:hypothetical protein